MKRAFVAKSHLCWFSKKLDYNKRTVGDVMNIDPDYLLWCYENLTHLRFATGIENQLKKYREEKLNKAQNVKVSDTTKISNE